MDDKSLDLLFWTKYSRKPHDDLFVDFFFFLCIS